MVYQIDSTRSKRPRWSHQKYGSWKLLWKRLCGCFLPLQRAMSVPPLAWSYTVRCQSLGWCTASGISSRWVCFHVFMKKIHFFPHTFLWKAIIQGPAPPLTQQLKEGISTFSWKCSWDFWLTMLNFCLFTAEIKLKYSWKKVICCVNRMISY